MIRLYVLSNLTGASVTDHSEPQQGPGESGIFLASIATAHV